MSKISSGSHRPPRRKQISRGIFGLSFAAGFLALASAASAQTVQEVRIEWTTAAPPAPGAQAQRFGQASSHLFSVLGRQKMVGRLPRQREPELSSDRIVVIARDSAGKILNWQITTDPRVIRSETAGPGGELSGTVFYRARADLLFALPNDPGITRVEFYQPRWAGAHFDLDLLGAVALP